jgi:hypothetical protein
MDCCQIPVFKFVKLTVLGSYFHFFTFASERTQGSLVVKTSTKSDETEKVTS